jgi:hypothetical protein
MKTLVHYSALLLIVLLISSCGNANQNTPSNHGDTNTLSNHANQNTPSNYGDTNRPSYFGDWTVRRLVGSTPISAPDDESIIGMKATYTNEKASFDKDEILNPEYKELELTNDGFFNEYRNQLSDIGINTNSVKTVEIINWTNAGSVLFIKDDQTMIFLWDGNYYEMKREK